VEAFPLMPTPPAVTVCEPTLVRAGIRVDIDAPVPRLCDGPDALFHDRCFARHSQVWYPRY